MTETLPFGLTGFPFHPANQKVIAVLSPRWMRYAGVAQIFFLFVVLFAWIGHVGWSEELLFPNLLVLWMLGAVVLGQVAGAVRQRQMRASVLLRGPMRVRMSPDGLTVLSGPRCSTYPPESIVDVVDWRGHLILAFDNFTYLPLPPEAFPDADARERFRSETEGLRAVPRQEPSR